MSEGSLKMASELLTQTEMLFQRRLEILQDEAKKRKHKLLMQKMMIENKKTSQDEEQKLNSLYSILTSFMHYWERIPDKYGKLAIKGGNILDHR
jgi:hypothetical protein